jgi:hypothetical protein
MVVILESGGGVWESISEIGISYSVLPTLYGPAYLGSDGKGFKVNMLASEPCATGEINEGASRTSKSDMSEIRRPQEGQGSENG